MSSNAMAKRAAPHEFAPQGYGGFFYTAHTYVDATHGSVFLKISTRSAESSNTALKVDAHTVAVERIYSWQLDSSLESDVQDVYAKRIYFADNVVHVELEGGQDIAYPVRTGGSK